MKYQVVRVDTSLPEVVKLLTWLQKVCLPDCPVYEITKDSYWFVAYSETGEAAGFAGLVPSSRWSDCMYMCRAGVIRAHRGQGLQKRLIRQRLKTAKKLGMNWVVTDTNYNTPSANNLIATGFKLFEPKKPWGFETALYWKYRIKRAV
jgi:GNAT superfamily N-acetyltransferase